MKKQLHSKKHASACANYSVNFQKILWICKTFYIPLYLMTVSSAVAAFACLVSSLLSRFDAVMVTVSSSYSRQKLYWLCELCFVEVGMSHLELKDQLKQVILAVWSTISLMVDQIRTLKRMAFTSRNLL